MHRVRRPTGGRRVVLAALVALLAAACGGGGTSATTSFQDPAAPFTFVYPQSFSRHAHLAGGAARNRPTFQVAFGPDDSSYILAATYRLLVHVRPDGSAVSATGQRVSARQLARDVDRAMAQIGRTAGLVADGPVGHGMLGSLPARVYGFHRADGSLATSFAVAFLGPTEYFTACQHTPQTADAIASACTAFRGSFTPQTPTAP